MPDQRQVTTHFVNSAEPLLVVNRDTFLTSPSAEAQVLALAEFDQTWRELTDLCGASSTGAAGVNCLRDRNRGGRWDWFSYYRDPIANWNPSEAAAAAAAASTPIAQPREASTGVPAQAGSVGTGSGNVTGSVAGLTNNETAVWLGAGLLGIFLLSRFLK